MHIASIIAAVFIFLFVYTALSKFLDFTKFTAVLASSPLIGSRKLWLAWSLPVTELFTAGLLFFPKTRRAGLYLSFFLMCLFTMYIAWMLLFAPHLPCSCGGIISKLTWKQHLLLNIFFMITTAVGIRMYRSRSNQQPNFLLQ